MLPRIVLFFLQLLAAWGLGDTITLPIWRGLSLQVSNQILVYAFVYAFLIMIVGYSGSKILKNVRSPSGLALIITFALPIVVALILITFPQVTQAIHGIIPSLRNNMYLYPLVAAMIGYYIAR